MTSQPLTGDDLRTPADRVRSTVIEEVLMRFRSVALRAGQAHGLRGDDLDDVLQDVRIRLWRGSATAMKLEALTGAYVYRAATSAALDFLRRQRARHEQSIGDADSIGLVSGLTSAPNAEQKLISNEVIDAVATAIQELAPNRRAVVRMYLAGYDRDEIATLLKWSEAKTRNLLYRGLDDLRDLLIARGIRPGGVS